MLLSFLTVAIISFLLTILLQMPAMAYVGPGAGIAAIGALIAIVIAVIAAIFGFAWYPIKRRLRKHKESQKQSQSTDDRVKQGKSQ
ncbi:MAG: hypothetical protein AAF609_01685 [Cyanobacteria bacterium P01_C01_bin.120]